MTITRIGVEGGADTGGQHPPFARAVGADGWLFVPDQTSMIGGKVVGNGIVGQSYQTIKNVLAILAEVGYEPEHVVHCGVWLDNSHDLQSFNKVLKEYFGANSPTCACVMSSMVIDCEVEVDCVAYKKS